MFFCFVCGRVNVTVTPAHLLVLGARLRTDALSGFFFHQTKISIKN
jgi:hypothetical protein